jgi:hypothetical protein
LLIPLRLTQAFSVEPFTSAGRQPTKLIKLLPSRNHKSIRPSYQIRARFVILEEADARRRARLVVVAHGSTCAARELPVGTPVSPTVVVLPKDNRERTATGTRQSKEKKTKAKAFKLPSCRLRMTKTR